MVHGLGLGDTEVVGNEVQQTHGDELGGADAEPAERQGEHGDRADGDVPFRSAAAPVYGTSSGGEPGGSVRLRSRCVSRCHASSWCHHGVVTSGADLSRGLKRQSITKAPEVKSHVRGTCIGSAGAPFLTSTAPDASGGTRQFPLVARDSRHRRPNSVIHRAAQDTHDRTTYCERSTSNSVKYRVCPIRSR